MAKKGRTIWQVNGSVMDYLYLYLSAGFKSLGRLGKILLIVGAFSVYIFMNAKILTFFLVNKNIAAIGTTQSQWAIIIRKHFNSL